MKKIILLLLCLCFIISFSANIFAYQTSPAVVYEQRTVTVSGKSITVNVIIADLSNPEINASVQIANDMLNSTKSFNAFVSELDPVAIVNGNFFNAYDTIKDPVGSLMSDGEFVYASSGLSSFGITNENKIIFGRPLIFTRINTTDNENSPALSWTAFEVNVLIQSGEQSVLYTPERGSSVDIAANGTVMTVVDSKITAYERVVPGNVQPIPANGYVVFFSDIVNSTDYFRIPEIGRSVEIEYTPFKEDEEKFDLSNVYQVLSGSPRLVKNFAIDNTPLESGFSGDARFETSSAPRTAIGKLPDGKLLIAYVPSVTIAQLKEAMLQLGVSDAINIDGGGSTGMYVNGSYIATPGRELTSVFVISKNQDISNPTPIESAKDKNIKVYIDGNNIQLEQAPIMENGRVLVPVRFIGEELGYNVNWNPETFQIHISDGKSNIILTLDSKEAVRDNNTITLDAAPTIVNGRTMVPVRFIAESFNADVNWNSDEPAVEIFSRE